MKKVSQINFYYNNYKWLKLLCEDKSRKLSYKIKSNYIYIFTRDMKAKTNEYKIGWVKDEQRYVKEIDIEGK